MNTIVDKTTMNTGLHIAFSTGDIDIVMYLIERGGSLNMLNINRHTPMAFDTNRLCAKLNLSNGIVTSKTS